MSSKETDAYGEKPYDPPSERKEHTEYERLRIILDSLELGALRYYLDNTDGPERTRRFEKLSATLVPICREFWGGKETIATAGCPDGYNSCDGVCVPYMC